MPNYAKHEEKNYTFIHGYCFIKNVFNYVNTLFYLYSNNSYL